MAEHKAKVVLSLEAHRQIEWFTKNFDKEIGAVGNVKLKTEEGEKYFYVEKLFFPRQKVSGATVHFKPEDWGSLIKNKEFLAVMGDIAFYWHKHPGSAAHSSTDEEDTFETFMSPEAKRKYFVFLQTANKTNGETDFEARIDLRSPIRTTILDKDIQILYELPPEDKALEETCKKIIEECIIKEVPKPAVIYHGQNEEAGMNTLRHWQQKMIAKGTPDDFDNNLINGMITSEEEQAKIVMENGQATVYAGHHFNKVMKTALEHEQGMLKSIVKKFKVSEENLGTPTHQTKYNLQPGPGQYSNLKDKLKKLFDIYNEAVVDMWKKEGKIEVKSATTTKLPEKSGSEVVEVKSGHMIDLILSELLSSFQIIWSSESLAKMYYYDGDMNEVVGTIRLTDNMETAHFEGDMVVSIVNDILNEEEKIADMTDDQQKDYHKEVEKVIKEEEEEYNRMYQSNGYDRYSYC